MAQTYHLQAIFTLLALVNPVVCAAIFSNIAGDQPRTVQLRLATQAALAVLIILVLAALFGARALHVFGISLDAFSVAGGGVLAWIGVSMLNPDSGQKAAAQPAGQSGASLAPLVMFAASPGTIMGAITLAVSHSRLALPVSALIAVAVASLVLWIVLLLAIYAGHKGSSNSFVHNTMTRFMGLIVVAMGVQFALTGLYKFFNGPLVS